MAYKLKTTIPGKNLKPKVLVCHACNNASCSNSNHLYWGTHSDNVTDLKESGYVYPDTIQIYADKNKISRDEALERMKQKISKSLKRKKTDN